MTKKTGKRWTMKDLVDASKRSEMHELEIDAIAVVNRPFMVPIQISGESRNPVPARLTGKFEDSVNLTVGYTSKTRPFVNTMDKRKWLGKDSTNLKGRSSWNSFLITNMMDARDAFDFYHQFLHLRPVDAEKLDDPGKYGSVSSPHAFRRYIVEWWIDGNKHMNIDDSRKDLVTRYLNKDDVLDIVFDLTYPESLKTFMKRYNKIYGNDHRYFTPGNSDHVNAVVFNDVKKSPGSFDEQELMNFFSNIAGTPELFERAKKLDNERLLEVLLLEIFSIPSYHAKLREDRKYITTKDIVEKGIASLNDDGSLAYDNPTCVDALARLYTMWRMIPGCHVLRDLIGKVASRDSNNDFLKKARSEHTKKCSKIIVQGSAFCFPITTASGMVKQSCGMIGNHEIGIFDMIVTGDGVKVVEGTRDTRYMPPDDKHELSCSPSKDGRVLSCTVIEYGRGK